MTPPPSDTDNPRPGGQKSGAVPPKAPEPVPPRVDAKREGRSQTPPAGGAKPTVAMPTQAPGGSSSPTSKTTASAPEIPSGPMVEAPPAKTADPRAAAKPGVAQPGDVGIGRDVPGPVSAGPTTSVPLGVTPKPAPAAAAASGPDASKLGGSAFAVSGPESLESEPSRSASPEPASLAALKSDGPGGAPKIEPSQSDPAKPETRRTGSAGAGQQGGARPGEPTATGPALTDGPIIDMKAVRVPDPRAPAAGPPETEAKDPAKRSSPAAAAAPLAHEPSPPPPMGKARGGFGSIAAAGLIGGVIGAGLLFAVGESGLRGGNDDARFAALDQKMAAQVSSVDRRVDGLVPRDALAGLDARVAAAESAAKQALDKAVTAPAQGAAASPAEGQASGSAPAVPVDLMARLDSLDQRVSALQEEPGRDQAADSKLGVAQGAASGDDAKQIATLDARVKALEGEAAKASTPMSDVAQTIASLQGEVASRTKADAEAGAALGQRVDSLQQALDARTKAATEAVQAATEATRTAAEAGQVQAAETSKAVDRRLQEQSDKIDGLDKSIARRAEASTVQAALRVVVADRVSSALASGTPYAEPLATLSRLDPGADAKVASLASFAETGAPTVGQLAASFRPITDRIAAKRRAVRAQNAAETGDFRTKLLSMTGGLVQVRKVDAPAPEATSDPEGKVQAALDRGDLRAASASFAALPAEAQGEAGDFGAKLKARAQAEEAAGAVLTDAFKALPTSAATSVPASGR